VQRPGERDVRETHATRPGDLADVKLSFRPPFTGTDAKTKVGYTVGIGGG
jgi:hypothetical protein